MAASAACSASLIARTVFAYAWAALSGSSASSRARSNNLTTHISTSFHFHWLSFHMDGKAEIRESEQRNYSKMIYHNWHCWTGTIFNADVIDSMAQTHLMTDSTTVYHQMCLSHWVDEMYDISVKNGACSTLGALNQICTPYGNQDQAPSVVTIHYLNHTYNDSHFSHINTSHTDNSTENRHSCSCCLLQVATDNCTIQQ